MKESTKTNLLYIVGIALGGTFVKGGDVHLEDAVPLQVIVEIVDKVSHLLTIYGVTGVDALMFILAIIVSVGGTTIRCSAICNKRILELTILLTREQTKNTQRDKTDE